MRNAGMVCAAPVGGGRGACVRHARERDAPRAVIRLSVSADPGVPRAGADTVWRGGVDRQDARQSV
jgi:hypothetical protein